MKNQILESIKRLDSWIEKNGWAGYDPYDIWGHPLFIQLKGKKNPIYTKALRKVMGTIHEVSPLTARKLLRIKEEINAKAMGLFAEGYRQLFAATGNERYLQRATQALEWLEAHPSEGYSGYCWGYPFDWQSRILIPKGTPSSVVSATVGQAFWGFYRMTQERQYLDICQRICEFFMKDLKADRLDNNQICFSYTPIDNYHVHNANLFVADFLVKVGLLIGKTSYVDQGMQAVRYTLSEQNDDGSICYWDRDQDDGCHIDHYHSGFEIRSLYGIWKSTQNAEIHRAIKLYYTFYRKRLFEGMTIPKMTPTSLYPIDIHSCAEAILCHSTLAPDFPEAWDYLKNCAPWILRTMQHPEGWFIYMVRKIKGRLLWKLKIPYIRWGQAWMLRALAQYYLLLSKNMASSVAKEGKAAL